jgi:hypothetical protein
VQLAPLRPLERACDADVAEDAVVVVQPEQQRRDLIARRSEPGDDAVGGVLGLDLDHDAAVRLVEKVTRLGDDAVHAVADELLEPALRRPHVGGDRRQQQRRREVLEQRLEPSPSLGERRLHQVVVAVGEEVEGDERRRRLDPQTLDARPRRMHPLQERAEVRARPGADDDLAVEHEAAGGGVRHGVDELREVPAEAVQVPALKLGPISVAVRERAEAVPLRLVQEVPLRQLARETREHRRDGRPDREPQRGSPSARERIRRTTFASSALRTSLPPWSRAASSDSFDWSWPMSTEASEATK